MLRPLLFVALHTIIFANSFSAVAAFFVANNNAFIVKEGNMSRVGKKSPVEMAMAKNSAADFAGVFFITSALLLGNSVIAHAADDADIIARGSKVFEANCAACHVGGQNLIAKEKTLQKDALTKYIGLDARNVKNFIQNSMIHRGALSFSGKLSDDDFTDVSAFVVDQAEGGKW